ncbi:MAG: signal peptidase I [Phycisphaerales bacterium]|nr:signal peptidase I [Phycisphaerales bacterium]
MAPTLLGAHVKLRGPNSGYTWTAGPWNYSSGTLGSGNPLALQQGVVVHDPMTGERIEGNAIDAKGLKRRSGDRILVLKFLYAIFEPRRYDVVVFKDPAHPQVNFIKRLIGLPGEMVALVDGDVFTRPTGSIPKDQADTWTQPGWRIARKPAHVQRAVWQPVFDSTYAPLATGIAFVSPWTSADGEGTAWALAGQGYRYTGTGPTTLAWDGAKTRYIEGRNSLPWPVTRELWAIDDRYPYDEVPNSFSWMRRFPVSDVRVRAGLDIGSATGSFSIRLAARGEEFVAEFSEGGGGAWTVSIKSRAEGEAAFRELASGPAKGLKRGKVCDVEFWHADQSVQVWIGAKLVAHAEYEWEPSERIARATGRTVEQVMETAQLRSNPLADTSLYRAPQVSWTFAGPVTMHRVGLDRDLHYQPVILPPGLGTHPSRPAVLSRDEFFCLGDNSPASSDGRMWDMVDPWVAHEMWTMKGLEPKAGIVPRELMMGKAFFVYFPAAHFVGGTIPVPDVGRLRFID